MCVVGMMACRPSSPLSQLQGPVADGSRPTLHVVSIGIENYGSAALRQGGADTDAGRVAEALVAIATPFYTPRVHTLSGARATRAAVMAVLDSVQHAADSDDLVVLYFRGLGGPRFLVLADSLPMPSAPSAPGAQAPASFETRLLRNDALATWLLTLHARQIVLVFEAPDASSYFHSLRERFAAPLGAVRAVKDLAALATPGTPSALTFASGETGVLTAALLESLDEERAARGLSLFSTLLPRVMYRLDAPIVVHEAGADLVLGADASARQVGDALRDSTRWEACTRDCPTMVLEGIENDYTLVGRAVGLAPSATLFVNGRRARRAGQRFEVELPPAALRAEISLRVLCADFTRFEESRRVP